MRVLGIETSCDETGIAVVETGPRVVVNHVASQIAVHAPFGGVVPEIASRQHTKIISQLTEQTVKESGGPVDAIAVTNGPGLMGSLLVGVNFAKALAMTWGVPFVPVHHLEGHIYSAMLDGGVVEWPALALLVSGGHTCLIECAGPHQYAIIASTRDDAVGECFDKVARLMGLPYPGGPSIQKAAEGGDINAFDLPIAFAQSDELAFSYSGLKTAVLYTLQRNPDARTADLAASFQATAVEALLLKTRAAITKLRPKCLIVAGGVAANGRLRERLAEAIDIPVLLPPLKYCVDNGAMIAAAGLARLERGERGSNQTTPSSALALA